MAEEQFVQMYVREFTTLAARAESGSDVELQLKKRVSETRSHAELMDRRKSSGHLTGVIDRLKAEAKRNPVAALRTAPDPVAAAARREIFLLKVADMLEREPAEPEPTGMKRF